MRSLITRQRGAYVVAAIGSLALGNPRLLHAQSAAGDTRFDALVSLTEAKMKEFGVPGVALGVIDGNALRTRGLGVTNVEDSIPVNAHTVFPIASISKTFAATAMMRLVEQGKVRYLGASSMAAWQMARALKAADARGLRRFVSMQNHYNLAYREEEREMIPLCLSEGLGLVPWSPLARGFLSGSRSREKPQPTERAQNDEFADNLYFKEADFRVLDAVKAVAAAREVSPAQVALAWLLGQGREGCSVNSLRQTRPSTG